MKKVYLLGLLSICAAGAFAQAHHRAPQGSNAASASKHMGADYAPVSPVVAEPTNTTPYGKSAGATSSAVKVGQTTFGIQTNASVYRRIITYPDGKMSVIWTTATDDPSSGFLSRGTGYNHFNGTSWGAVNPQRIEGNSFRTGYPNFDYSSVLGKEIVMAHKVDTGGNATGLAYSTNASIGSTQWNPVTVLANQTNKPSVLWPRTAVSGNYMHVLATFTVPNKTQTDSVKISGVKNPTVYSRYNFSTSTWEVQNITLPGYDSTRWFSGNGDGYAIDVKDSLVAILMGDNTGDITLWKSIDNGQTWTERIIDSFPYPAYNNTPFTDTITTSDGTLSLKLDNNGMAHCFWGRLRVSFRQGTSDLGVFLGTNSIDYWSETMPDSIRSIAGAPDLDGDNTLTVGDINERTRYGNSGMATMPYAVMDQTGKLYVIYSALTENDLDASGSAFRDIYCVVSTDNGATWSAERNLTGFLGLNEEDMFGTAAADPNGTLHITYMKSAATGNFDATNNPNKLGPFDIMYLKTPLFRIDEGSTGIEEKTPSVTVSQNYPNPFRYATTIPVNMKQGGDVNVSVTNLVGQVVYTKSFRSVAAGQGSLEITPSSLNSGVYFYNVETNGYKATGKMIVE